MIALRRPGLLWEAGHPTCWRLSGVKESPLSGRQLGKQADGHKDLMEWAQVPGRVTQQKTALLKISPQEPLQNSILPGRRGSCPQRI